MERAYIAAQGTGRHAQLIRSNSLSLNFLILSINLHVYVPRLFVEVNRTI